MDGHRRPGERPFVRRSRPPIIEPRTSESDVKWLLLLLLAGALVGAGLFLPLGAWALAFVEWVREAGPLGLAAFVVAYVAATVLFLPGSALTLAAGFLWGPVGGLLVASPTSVLAASVAFLVGRTVAREAVAKRLGANERFAAIDRAIAREGGRFVLLLRLSPVFPFNLLNYALGLTSVPFGRYVLASFVGMLPGTFLFTYLGSLVTSAAELLAGRRPAAGAAGTALYWGGLAATVVATVLVTRAARRELAKSLAAG